MKEKKKIVATFIAGFCYLFVIIIILAAFTPIPNFLARPLIIQPRPEKADAILVLSGGVYPNGSLSYFGQERVVQGVLLYKKGLAQKIIFSGGVSLGNHEIDDAGAMKKVAVDLGVKEEDTLLENQSRDTLENLVNSKKIIEEKEFQKVLLVTSAIHTYRSILIAKRLGLELIPASPNPFEEYRQTPIDRLLLFYFTIREYGALLLYRLNIG